MGGFGGGEAKQQMLLQLRSQTVLRGSQELSDFSQIEARGLGICAPLWILRSRIPLGKRHSLGQGGFLWVKGILQEGLS